MFKPLKTLPLALLAIGGTAEALTLGQIHVQSFINEPLKAVIDVNEATGDELKALKVKLANRNAFSKVGVDYTSEVQGLRFAVVESPKGTRIEVTSQGSITEPFLSFVIDADWNKGSVSKDYTVLLDPPIYTNRFAAPVTPADAGIVRSDEIPEPVAETEPAPAPSQPAQPVTPEKEAAPAQAETAPVPSGEMKSVGPTAAGSNLWTIARDNKPQAATIQQAMVAIHEANPDAFMRGNMNLMKQGQLLRIPPPEVIDAISQAAAETRISQHQKAWKSGEAVASSERLSPEIVAATPQTETAETAATGATAATTTGSAAMQEGRLELASAGSSASDASDGAPADTGESSAESLQSDLIKAREEMLSTREENRELRERNSMLEEQLESQKKLIQLQNEQLARLQEYYRRLNEQGGDATGLQKPDLTPVETDEPPAAGETPDEVASGVEETDVAAETGEQAEAATAQEGEAVEAMAEETAEEAPAAEVTEETPAEETAEEAPAAQVTEEAPAEEATEQADAAPVVSSGEEGAQQQPAPAETSLLASLMKNNTVVYGATATGIGILGLLALWLMRRRKSPEEAEESILATELATTEPLSEARPVEPAAPIDVLDRVDPLIARDELGEAKQLLENAILEEPERYELHLKMLDLMHISGDLAGFEEYLGMLEAANFQTTNPEAWTWIKQQHEDMQTRAGSGKSQDDSGMAATAAAAGSAAVASDALDRFAEIDESEDDLMPGVEDEEALEAIQKLDTSLDDVTLEDLDALSESVEEKSEQETEEPAEKPETSIAADLGEQDDLESALKLFEMELEGRHPDATDIPEETKSELAETAELLDTGTTDAMEEPAETAEAGEKSEFDIDFATASEEFETAAGEPVDTIDMETAEEASEEAPSVSEEEVQAKVELAEAFAEMGDVEGAREILNEVMREGNDSQRSTAEEILQKYAS
ncbi:MAG: FimV/HubP family polar landmark protein [Chromatiales bacterium]|jgi:pilus assembly protein FimV